MFGHFSLSEYRLVICTLVSCRLYFLRKPIFEAKWLIFERTTTTSRWLCLKKHRNILRFRLQLREFNLLQLFLWTKLFHNTSFLLNLFTVCTFWSLALEISAARVKLCFINKSKWIVNSKWIVREHSWKCYTYEKVLRKNNSL